MKVTFFAKTSRRNLELVEFYRQDIELLRELGYTVDIATSLRRIDFGADLVFIWWWTYAAAPVLLSRVFGYRTVITGTFNFRPQDFDLGFFERPWYQQQLIKFALVNADANVVVSKHETRAIRTEWKLKNLHYSPHTVAVADYKPGTEGRDNFVFSLLGMTERILWRKCMPEILQAWKRVEGELRGAHLVIAGRRGDGEDWLQGKIERLGLRNRVEYVGEVDRSEKIRLMQACRIYLQPSRYEGFGLAIAEAMSCGAPVISTRVGAVPEVVGDAGVLLDDCSPDALCDAVVRLYTDGEARRRLGEKARERVREHFHPDRRKRDLERVIAQVM